MIRDLALAAIAAGRSLAEEVAARPAGATIDLAAALAAGQVLGPIDHPDAAHLLLSGTGLTHLGSAGAGDKMHKAASAADTDRSACSGWESRGRQARGDESGVQPVWFYKGDGGALVAPAPLSSPAFALDGAGEKLEIAGVYVIGEGERVHRIGFALANEFSDRATEQRI